MKKAKVALVSICAPARRRTPFPAQFRRRGQSEESSFQTRREKGKNDKKSQKFSLAFCGGTPYNRSAKWLKVEGNGAFSPEEEGQQR